MSIGRVFASALLLSVPAAPALADAGRAFERDCWQEREAAAAQIQGFKTMLLVGALHCRDSQPYIMADYNDFVRAQRGFIAANAQLIRDRFVRRHGPTYGINAYTDYETMVGNRAANVDYTRYRCERIANYARLAAQVSQAGLMDLARSVGDEQQLAICAPMHYAGGRWAPRAEVAAALPPAPPPLADIAPPVPPPAPAVELAVATPPPPPPAPAPAETEWPDLAPVTPESHPVAVDPNTAVKVAAADVARLQPVAAAPAAAEALKPNPAQALRDAIKSLTIAAEALEAQQGGAPATR